MYNKVILQGNLTKEIELVYTKGGTAIGNSTIAVTEKYKDKETTLFIDIVILGKQAETLIKYIKKGSKVLIDGKLKLDSWTNNNNQKVYKHSILINSIVMLDCKKNNQQPTQQQQTYSNPPKMPEIDINSDTIPF